MRKKQYKYGSMGSGIDNYLIRESKNKNIVSNSVRMHRLSSLISFFLSSFNFQNIDSKQQNVLVFNIFSAVRTLNTAF